MHLHCTISLIFIIGCPPGFVRFQSRAEPSPHDQFTLVSNQQSFSDLRALKTKPHHFSFVCVYISWPGVCCFLLHDFFDWSFVLCSDSLATHFAVSSTLWSCFSSSLYSPSLLLCTRLRGLKQRYVLLLLSIFEFQTGCLCLFIPPWFIVRSEFSHFAISATLFSFIATLWSWSTHNLCFALLCSALLFTRVRGIEERYLRVHLLLFQSILVITSFPTIFLSESINSLAYVLFMFLVNCFLLTLPPPKKIYSLLWFGSGSGFSNWLYVRNKFGYFSHIMPNILFFFFVSYIYMPNRCPFGSSFTAA
jgi:hypothetical protein